MSFKLFEFTSTLDRKGAFISCGLLVLRSPGCTQFMGLLESFILNRTLLLGAKSVIADLLLNKNLTY